MVSAQRIAALYVDMRFSRVDVFSLPTSNMANSTDRSTEEPHEPPTPKKGSAYMRPVKQLFTSILSRHRSSPTLYQCGYCYEQKPAKAFKYPFFCRVHLPKPCVNKLKRTPVCYECLRTAVATQLDTRLASRMGCPDCFRVWTTPDICFLLSFEKRMEYSRKLKQEMRFVREHLIVRISY